MKLTLFNTLTKKKEQFLPLDNKNVKMYVCGPTVYDYPHIGNARSVAVYDILYRLLMTLYGAENVKYVRNITDVDDKIINKANEENIHIDELTKKTTKYFHDNMEYLYCLPPNIEPKATEHIQEMIDIISILLDKKIAYTANNHVYFDISKSPNYTDLSGRSIEDMLKAVRIEEDKNKKNPGDFVLWKPAKPGEEKASFDSPFGLGRPGWHIECSAMSHKYLGENFDIHGGGADLIFPHHTNEIAQSCCAFENSKFAKYWIHNGFLTVNHEKMSKSLGNFITVQDLENKKIKGEIVRLFLLSNHYKKPLDYNEKAINDISNMLDYWYRAIEISKVEIKNIENDTENLPKEFLEILLNDLDTHNAIKYINDTAKKIYTESDALNLKKYGNQLVICAKYIGLINFSTQEWFQNDQDIDIALIENLIQQRIEAKKNKNWAVADKIRNDLLDMEIKIEDTADGKTIWRK